MVEQPGMNPLPNCQRRFGLGHAANAGALYSANLPYRVLPVLGLASLTPSPIVPSERNMIPAFTSARRTASTVSDFG